MYLLKTKNELRKSYYVMKDSQIVSCSNFFTACLYILFFFILILFALFFLIFLFFSFAGIFLPTKTW